MKKEKLILSFVATLIGLIVAGSIFFFYESSKQIPESQMKKVEIHLPSPTPKPSIFLNIDTPKNQEVSTKKVVTLSGTTSSDATISIMSNNYQDIINPSATGSFSTTLDIADGENFIEIAV